MRAGVPDVVRIHVDCCEYIEQVLDIHILCCDLPHFFKPGLSGSSANRQSVEVVIFGCTEELRRFWTFGAEVVPEWC